MRKKNISLFPAIFLFWDSFKSNENKPALRYSQLLHASETPSPSSSSPSSPSTSRTTSPTAPIRSFFPRFILWLWLVVDKQRVEGQTVRENVISNGGATDVDGIKGDGIATFRGHLDRPKRGIHLRRDRGNGAVENSAVLELDSHGLVRTFHKKSNKLHDARNVPRWHKGYYIK